MLRTAASCSCSHLLTLLLHLHLLLPLLNAVFLCGLDGWLALLECFFGFLIRQLQFEHAVHKWILHLVHDCRGVSFIGGLLILCIRQNFLHHWNHLFLELLRLRLIFIHNLLLLHLLLDDSLVILLILMIQLPQLLLRRDDRRSCRLAVGYRGSRRICGALVVLVLVRWLLCIMVLLMQGRLWRLLRLHCLLWQHWSRRLLRRWIAILLLVGVESGVVLGLDLTTAAASWHANLLHWFLYKIGRG